ncbi:MAG: exosortase H [Syntrophobacteraceae bacterium]
MSRKTSTMRRKRAVKAETADLGPWSDLKFSAGFVLKFLACSIMLYALAIWLPESAFDPLNENTARMAAYCLNLVGMHPVLAGRDLSQNGFPVSVITECSTLYMGILFFSFVVSYPTTLRRKFIGFPLGVAVLQAGNILRIAAVFAIGVQNRGSFELVHVYVGQVLMVLFVLAVCLAWLRAWAEPFTREHDLFSFLIGFLAFSSIPFLLWLPLNKEYVKLTDLAVTGLFSLFDYRLLIPYQHAIYYQTFNVVTFTGLVLATRRQPAKWKFQLLAAGLAAIFIMHILFRVCNVLVTAFHNEPAERLAAGISISGQYLLPVGLWLLMVRKKPRALKQPH